MSKNKKMITLSIIMMAIGAIGGIVYYIYSRKESNEIEQIATNQRIEISQKASKSKDDISDKIESSKDEAMDKINELLNEQIESRKPQLLFKHLSSIVGSVKGKFVHPQTQFAIHNIGERTAFDCSSYCFIVHPEYRYVYMTYIAPSNVMKGKIVRFKVGKRLEIEFDTGFYFIIKTLFTDKKIDKDVSELREYFCNKTTMKELYKSNSKSIEAINAFLNESGLKSLENLQ